MVKHTQTVCWFLPTNVLNMFDHLARLGLKGLKFNLKSAISENVVGESSKISLESKQRICSFNTYHVLIGN